MAGGDFVVPVTAVCFGARLSGQCCPLLSVLSKQTRMCNRAKCVHRNHHQCCVSAGEKYGRGNPFKHFLVNGKNEKTDLICILRCLCAKYNFIHNAHYRPSPDLHALQIGGLW